MTFLFTDVEGSTRLWEEHPEAMRAALIRHDALIEGLVAEHGGVVVRPRGEGDSRFAVFSGADDAVAAACEIQVALHQERWSLPRPLRVRLALHTGEADLRQGDYYGSAVNRCARLRGTAHGGQSLLSGTTAALVRDCLPPGLSLRGLGTHRLKDLAEPEQVFQLVHPELPATFAPLLSLDPVRHNLPIQPTRFIGRQQEIGDLKARLATARLLTLTGAGGIGKTRLALQLAAETLDAFPDGVWLVELAALTDPALVLQAVAPALGVQEQPQQPLIATLREALAGKELLLVLDNCEHLVESCARLAAELLAACPHLRILASSREVLGVAGETVWRVPSLSVPDGPSVRPDEVLSSEAGRLFVDRALAAAPTFALTARSASAVAQICRRLDGLPLAIELAAARVRALSVEQIAARLDQRFRLLTSGSRVAPSRQQTLRATVEWSYSLLSPPERVLFDRLGVFVGSFELEAAEAVCAGEKVEAWDVVDPLASLIDKSLVLAGEEGGAGRYRLLETIHEFARERLAQSGEAEACGRRHAAYYSALAEAAEPELLSAQEAGCLDKLEREHDNLRAALRWCVKTQDARTGLRLGGVLSRLWFIRGYLSEGNRWLEELLALPGASASKVELANVLNGAGNLAAARGDYDQSRTYLEESLALRRELGDKRGIARSLLSLGALAGERGDYKAARGLFGESLALRRELGDKLGVARALQNLGALVREEGDYTRAAELCQEALAVARTVRDQRGVALAMIGLGILARHQGQVERALALLRESLREFNQLGDRREITECLELLAGLAGVRGHPEQAVRLLGAADALIEANGLVPGPMQRHQYESDRAALTAQLGEIQFATAWSEGRKLSLQHAVALALEEAVPS